MSAEIGFNISVFAKTDVGRIRPGNEDNFLVLNLSTADTWTPATVAGDPPENLAAFMQSYYGSLLAVTDGMGGALAGEVASSLAVECVRDRMLELQASPTYSKLPFHERLRLSIEMANLYIYQKSVRNPEYAGMGATFTAVAFNGTTAYFGQVGDSRAYLIRNGHVQQVTRDQSLVGQLVEAGHITEEEAEKHTYKNVILQALGASPNINVVVDRVSLENLDTLVLCSDGLSNKVRPEEMAEIVEKSQSLKEACEMMVAMANQRGGEDNITVLIAQVAGGRLIESSANEATTVPLAGKDAAERWGAETIPRDPNLPYEIDSILLDDEDETIPPES
jgi:protein phosphatase